MKPLLKPLCAPLSPFSQTLLALVGFGVLFAAYSFAVNRQWDFNVYYLAAHALSQGLSPYNPQTLHELSDSIIGVGYAGLPYLYSPLLARLLYPLTFVPFFEAAFIWVVLKCAALELSLLIILRLLNCPFTFLNWLGLHAAAVFYRPIALDMNSGNVAVFESALVLLFFGFWKNGCTRRAAMALTAAASLFKAVPLLLALYPLHIRDWRLLRGLALFIAALAAYFLLDIHYTTEWLRFFQSREWQRIWDEQVQSFYNSSSTTVILRTFTETYFSKPLIHLDWLAFALIPLVPLGIFAVSCWAVQSAFNRSRPPFDPSLFSLLICAILLLPPRLAGYTLAWTLFPFVYSFVESIRRRRVFAQLMVVIALILFQLQLPPEHIPHGIAQLLIDKDFFGLLALYFSLIYIIRKSYVNH